MTQSDKRDRIFKAALELIAEHGFHGTPMAMIAEKAGVAAGTIYRYFESKEQLIVELFSELRQRIHVTLTESYIKDTPLGERYCSLCTSLLEYLIVYPLHFRFMEQYLNSPFGVSWRRDKILGKTREQDVFMDLFMEGIERRVLKSLPLYVLAVLTFSPLVSLARDHNLGLVTLDKAIIKQSIDACWDGIKIA